MHVFRLLCAVACLALFWPGWAIAQIAPPNAQQSSLHAMVESAWQRSPQARALVARQDEAAAGKELAGSWLAAPPALELSQRSDRWTGQRGQRESEVALSTTFWTPGQKSRRANYAEASASELEAQLLQARLETAGQVRARLWEAAAAREVELEKHDHLQHLEELARDVQRRVVAGDLPRSDALLAQQEVLAAQSALILARGNAKSALSRFTLLTGLTGLPDFPPIEADASVAEANPVQIRVKAAQAAELRARAAVAAASAHPSAAPTLAVSMRRERDGMPGPSERSIGLALQIPLVGKQRNRPLETAAATQLAAASAELAQVQAESQADLDLARERIRDAEEAFAIATQRASTALEHTRLMEKAFALGERPLPEVLRSRIQSHEAQLAARQYRVVLGQARAGLNQALGIIP